MRAGKGLIFLLWWSMALPALSQQEEFDILNISLEELSQLKVLDQKREQNLQDIAMAVTAIEEQQLREYGVYTLKQLGPLVLGLVMAHSGHDLRPSMRGARTPMCLDSCRVPIQLRVIYK